MDPMGKLNVHVGLRQKHFCLVACLFSTLVSVTLDENTSTHLDLLKESQEK